MCFSPYLGSRSGQGGGDSSERLVHIRLTPLFTLVGSKTEALETYSFHIATS